jgi:hypothetical protein
MLCVEAGVEVLDALDALALALELLLALPHAASDPAGSNRISVQMRRAPMSAVNGTGPRRW